MLRPEALLEAQLDQGHEEDAVLGGVRVLLPVLLPALDRRRLHGGIVFLHLLREPVGVLVHPEVRAEGRQPHDGLGVQQLHPRHQPGVRRCLLLHDVLLVREVCPAGVVGSWDKRHHHQLGGRPVRDHRHAQGGDRNHGLRRVVPAGHRDGVRAISGHAWPEPGVVTERRHGAPGCAGFHGERGHHVLRRSALQGSGVRYRARSRDAGRREAGRRGRTNHHRYR
mmetsp:Transcript_25801/g.53637  ORF Transcript_25801/g.53637 Transcript_25801/m.53637 type:complete len:224 (-) Transcript_25801:109-780(-)